MFGNGYNFYPGVVGLGAKRGILSGLTGKLNWSTILGNTQKTLGIINQAIPIFYQVKPIWNNAKTVFKIMGAIKEDDTSTSTNSATNTTPTDSIDNTYISEEPQFFL